MLHENSFVAQGATIRDWYQELDSFPISKTDGSFQIAFGIADLADRRSTGGSDVQIKSGLLLDPLMTTSIPESVGKLEAWYRTRAIEADGSMADFVYEKQETSLCTKIELGLSEE